MNFARNCVKAFVLVSILSADCQFAPYDCTQGRLNECRAQAIIHTRLGLKDDQTPEIHWWYEKCPSDGVLTGVLYDGACYSGLQQGWYLDVAWRGTFHDSAYVHEYIHFWQELRGVYDPNHTIEVDWALGREIDSRLASEGL